MLCLVPFPPDGGNAPGFIHVGVPVSSAAVGNPSPLDLEAGLKVVVPDGAVPAVTNPSVAPGLADRQLDGLSHVSALVAFPVGAPFEENPDDLGAVGQVDMCDFSLRPAHCVRENDVSLIQEFGNLLGVDVADVLLFHGVFLSRLSALSI